VKGENRILIKVITCQSAWACPTSWPGRQGPPPLPTRPFLTREFAYQHTSFATFINSFNRCFLQPLDLFFLQKIFPTSLHLPPLRFHFAEDAAIEPRTVAEFELKSEISTCYKVPGRLSPLQGQLSSTTAFHNAYISCTTFGHLLNVTYTITIQTQAQKMWLFDISL
jgi:hypothetical protein